MKSSGSFKILGSIGPVETQRFVGKEFVNHTVNSESYGDTGSMEVLAVAHL